LYSLWRTWRRLNVLGRYRRYLVGALRREFDLPGTPIRLMLRKGPEPLRAGLNAH
jgi:predicted GTPase